MEYKTVPLPVAYKGDMAKCTEELDQIINTHAREGWDFVGLQTRHVTQMHGKGAKFFGKTDITVQIDIAVFRRDDKTSVSYPLSEEFAGDFKSIAHKVTSLVEKVAGIAEKTDNIITKTEGIAAKTEEIGTMTDGIADGLIAGMAENIQIQEDLDSRIRDEWREFAERDQRYPDRDLRRDPRDYDPRGYDDGYPPRSPRPPRRYR